MNGAFVMFLMILKLYIVLRLSLFITRVIFGKYDIFIINLTIKIKKLLKTKLFNSQF